MANNRKIKMLKLNKFLIFAIIATTITISSGEPHNDDPLTPIIKFLKALRRRNRYSSYNRNDELGEVGAASGISQSISSSSGSSSNFNNNNNNNFNSNSNGNNNNRDPVIVNEFLGQRPSSSSNFNRGSSNSNSFSSADQIQRIIQQSSGGGGSGSSSNTRDQSSNSGSLLGNLGNLNLGNLASLPGAGGTSLPPVRIEQINRGISTILGGVGSGSLERILRGSFMFTRNENVVKVANNVLDSIFGKGNGGSK